MWIESIEEDQQRLAQQQAEVEKALSTVTDARQRDHLLAEQASLRAQQAAIESMLKQARKHAR